MSLGRRRALYATLAVVGISSAVLAATGPWLARNYRPARPEEVAPDRFRFVLGGGWIHEAHVWAAIVLQAGVVLVGGSALLLVERLRRRDATDDDDELDP